MHIGHKNAIEFDQRPFSSLDEMSATIIANWNDVVTDNDEVYILGDMFWNNKEASEILSILNGKKYLILGNHDRVNAEMQKYFVWIKEIESIKDEGTHVILCHYPIAHWKNQDRGYVHLYGHIHRGRDSRPFEKYKNMCEAEGIQFEAYNVGCMCDYMDYTPRTLSEIINANKDG